MKNKLALNIIHRPELSPEYSEKAYGSGDGVRDESLDIFRFQQDSAHKYGLKTTIQITYASLFSDIIIEEAKRDREMYGDEIGLSLLGLPCPEFRAKYKTEDFCIWMFDEKTKMKIIDDVFEKFYEAFGFYPESTGSYFLDAFTINYIKEKYPSVKCAVATCWEEGPKAFHTCNNSWYTFMDGGPWNPWIPSKVNSHCPASGEDDDSGIVAIPHLSRDLMACFDGNGSNFGTHPQNVLRGMIYYKENEEYEYPYLFNLIDQYRHLSKYNDGYSYNMMFVGPGWLNKRGRWESPYELLAKSYDDAMCYYGKLKKKGELVDMTMSEFADYYRSTHKDYKRGECALWKDILYGSNKEYFWYLDPALRTCFDFNQGGAMIDLRPYAARLPQKYGIGTENVYDASYPYLIQINYRAGYFTHYAGAGTIRSCKVTFRGETTDLCLTRTMATYSRENGAVKLTLDPVTVTLGGKDIVIGTTVRILDGEGVIETERRILNDLGGERVEFYEYLTGGFGTTEYQADMTDITLGTDCDQMQFGYLGRKIRSAGASRSYVKIPAVMTEVSMGGDIDLAVCEEGIAFSPVYHIAVSKTIDKGGFRSWLRLQREG